MRSLNKQINKCCSRQNRQKRPQFEIRVEIGTPEERKVGGGLVCAQVLESLSKEKLSRARPSGDLTNSSATRRKKNKQSGLARLSQIMNFGGVAGGEARLQTPRFTWITRSGG